MKEFAIYTALRLGLFALCFVVLEVVGVTAFGNKSAVVLTAFVLSIAMSSALSWRLLRSQRERFAARVDQRAARAASKFEELRAREDAD